MRGPGVRSGTCTAPRSALALWGVALLSSAELALLAFVATVLALAVG
ncbi:hypothetical protein [Streptomyces sp. B93]|nr:hypothetical protein [Streptomyces sp. B93]MBQ1089010.1 hypothetical protein [Streptomyces sp. B93]